MVNICEWIVFVWILRGGWSVPGVLRRGLIQSFHIPRTVRNTGYYVRTDLFCCRFNQHQDPEHSGVVARHGACVGHSTHGAGRLHPTGRGVLPPKTQWPQATVAPSNVKRNRKFCIKFVVVFFYGLFLFGVGTSSVHCQRSTALCFFSLCSFLLCVFSYNWLSI